VRLFTLEFADSSSKWSSVQFSSCAVNEPLGLGLGSGIHVRDSIFGGQVSGGTNDPHIRVARPGRSMECMRRDNKVARAMVAYVNTIDQHAGGV